MTCMKRLLPVFSLLAFIALAACKPGVESETGAVDATDRHVFSERAWPVPETVVIVMIDTLRADILGAYGSARGLTPHLDAFANQAVVFANAYGSSSWTRSSVASMLSGRYPTSHTALGKLDILPDEVLLLPEILESNAPTWSFGITTNANTSAGIGFGQGYDHYGPVLGAEKRRYPQDQIGLVPGEAVSGHALELFKDERQAGVDTTFAFIQYIDPHDPYFPNPEFMPGPVPDGEYSGSRRDIDAMVAAGKKARTQNNIARLRYLYDGEVAYNDHAFGELIDGLKRMGLYDEALIIVVSDHGEAFWEHGKRGHGKSLYEEEIRVPFMIKLPGMEPPSTLRIEQAVSVVDITPTILDAMKIVPSEEIEGRSLLPLINGLAREERLEYVFAELHFFENKSVTTIRHDTLKLLATYWHKRKANKVVLELFDLEGDPLETSNLIDDNNYAHARNELVGALSAWESDVLDWALDSQRVKLEDMDDEIVDELKGLGYIK